MSEHRWRAERVAADEAAAQLAIGLVGFALGIAPDQIASRSRGTAAAAFARQVAMYLCHVACERSLSRVAYAFGRDRSTIAHACHVIEDRRDEAAFDDWIASLEEAIRAAPSPTQRVAALGEGLGA